MRESQLGKKAIIHIGVHKTGTSAIQHTLFGSRDALLSRWHVLYPSVAENVSVRLGAMFRGPSEILQFADRRADDSSAVPGIIEGFYREFDTELSKPDWQTLVISAESLSTFNVAATNDFIKWLADYVDEIEIVAYIRNPIDWSRSVSQQQLKTSGWTLEKAANSPAYPNWRRRLSPWLNAVGRDRFTLISFDAVRENNDLVGSFYDAAGLPREAMPSPSTDALVNESMSQEAALILSSLNEQQPLFSNGKLSLRRRWGATKLIQGIPGSKFSMPSSYLEKVRHESRDDLRWVNSVFEMDLYPDIFFEIPIPEEESSLPSSRTADGVASALAAAGERIEDLTEKNRNLRLQLKKLRERNSRLKTRLDNH